MYGYGFAWHVISTSSSLSRRVTESVQKDGVGLLESPARIQCFSHNHQLISGIFRISNLFRAFSETQFLRKSRCSTVEATPIVQRERGDGRRRSGSVGPRDQPKALWVDNEVLQHAGTPLHQTAASGGLAPGRAWSPSTPTV